MDLSKKAQTLIASLICVILFFIYPNIVQSQEIFLPNNKFGIHIISPVPKEASDAASLVNKNGDWGYVTFLIQSSDRNKDKWQEFFNELRRRHLIPIVRLATKPVNEHWERPYEKEYEVWADFLDSLNWPIKNRYVVIYNEPNHGKEWGNSVDPKNYAETLDKTITALKSKNRDFFVLNAGFDQSTPHQPPNYFDEELFLQEMEKAVPGIFNKLDGWSSHSYPNPGFVGSPDDAGRGTVRGYTWELQVLRRLGVTKNLPVFITETGWQHAEGITFNSSLPTSDTVGQFLQNSFTNAWASSNVKAVTPFLLNYQQAPFDHFSFKKYTGEPQDIRILGVEYPDYYSQYQKVADMPKIKGQPLQENKAELIKGEIYKTLVSGQNYTFNLTFKNIGQSIWDDQVKLTGIDAQPVIGLVEPEQEYTFKIPFKASQIGQYQIVLNLMNKDKVFDSPSIEFKLQIKSPVVLIVKSGMNWKKNHTGDYYLETKGVAGESVHLVQLLENGQSQKLEAPFLLPDYNFEFTLSKPNYISKTIKANLVSGVNTLDFGNLNPDILGTLFKPIELWKLLPF